MKYEFDFSKEKDLVLKETRNITSEEVIEAYKKGKKLADLENKSKRRSTQRLLVVEMGGYAFVVPYLIDEERKTVFLKTIYPSRKLTKKYIQKNQNEKNKKV